MATTQQSEQQAEHSMAETYTAAAPVSVPEKTQYCSHCKKQRAYSDFYRMHRTKGRMELMKTCRECSEGYSAKRLSSGVGGKISATVTPRRSLKRGSAGPVVPGSPNQATRAETEQTESSTEDAIALIPTRTKPQPQPKPSTPQALPAATASSGFTPVNNSTSGPAGKRPRLEEPERNADGTMDVDQPGIVTEPGTGAAMSTSINAAVPAPLSRIAQKEVVRQRLHISESPQPTLSQPAQIPERQEILSASVAEQPDQDQLMEPPLPAPVPELPQRQPMLPMLDNNHIGSGSVQHVPQHLNGGINNGINNGRIPGQDLIAFAHSLGKLSELLLAAASELEPDSVDDLEEEIHHDWRVEEMATFVEGFVKGAKRRGARRW